MKVSPYAAAFATLVLLWITSFALIRSLNPWKAIIGSDCRPSTSKLQFFLWTLTVIFSYVAITTARFNAGHFEVVSSFPEYLLVAMGFSVATFAAAKGITVSYIENDSLTKTQGTSPSFGQVFKEDGGSLDLSKIQMLAWTMIAIIFYLINVNKQLGTGIPTLPDIDGSLMVLMGLSQGAYLGKKLVTSSTPRLSAIQPVSGKATDEITLMGTAFGEAKVGNVINIDNRPGSVEVVEWSDSKIRFKLPPARPDDTLWAPGQTLSIGLTVGGQDSANNLPFVVKV